MPYVYIRHKLDKMGLALLIKDTRRGRGVQSFISRPNRLFGHVHGLDQN